MTAKVLIVGSGPDAPKTASWDLSGFDYVIAINNAWRALEGWSHAIYPDDFPSENRPTVFAKGQTAVMSETYVPSQNRFGGVVMAGGTMAFTTSYWVLDQLAPAVMAFIGCDMVYANRGATHFYGTGAADPLRHDPTLQSLEAKSQRLEALAAQEGCALVNLSDAETRLSFPRARLSELRGTPPQPRRFDAEAVAACRAAETALGYRFDDGRYWDRIDQIDWAALRDIDTKWAALQVLDA